MRTDSPAPAVAQPPAVALLPLPGCAPYAPLLSTLRSAGFAVETLDEHAFDGAEPPPCSGLVVSMPPDAPERALRSIVTWCRRSPRAVGLIGLVPRGTREDCERALVFGFDDAMVGDISAREVAGRIRALVRRLGAPAPVLRERIVWGAIVVDQSRHVVELEGRRVPLTPREMGLLKTLIEAAGRTLTRDQLLDRVWGSSDLDIETRAVDSLVSRLRQKLGDTHLLVTVRGVGFRVGDP